MRIDQEDILSFLPQRAPFVMIDSLQYADGKISRGALMVSEDNIFVWNSKLNEPGLIENIAQTAAAGIGYISKLENRPAPVGYLGAVERVEINALPRIGDELATEVFMENQIMDATVVSGSIRCKGILLVQCKMKIFIKRKP